MCVFMVWYLMEHRGSFTLNLPHIYNNIEYPGRKFGLLVKLIKNV